MNLTWTKIGTIAAAIVALATIGGMLGYGVPWAPASLAATVSGNTAQIQALTRQEAKDSWESYHNTLRIQRSILLLTLLDEKKAHDDMDADQTQAQIDDINAQLRTPPPR